VLLGVLHDDGLNGDLISGDSTYTLSINGTQFSAPGAYSLYVSAAFYGTLLRAKSSSVQLTIVEPLVTVDSTWSTYHDQQFTIEVPPTWIASSTSYPPGSGPLRGVSFALPTDPTNPVLYIYVYPHGFDVDSIDEPPTYLGSDNRNDFYYGIQNGDEDPAVLLPLGLTDQTLHNFLWQIISTVQVQ
jgi:hypothetical protein